MFHRCLLAANNNAAADLVAEALALLNAAQNDAETNHNIPLQRNGAPGRPKYVIDSVQLENMLMLHFKVPQIAMLFGVSVRTIRRRMNEIRLHVSDLYSPICDDELDAVVSDIIQRFPNCGYRLMEGHLRSLNIRVQQQRIRDSFHRIASESIAVRWNETIVRRAYCVSSPLALWHIDGNHKLIRYVYVYWSMCNSSFVRIEQFKTFQTALLEQSQLIFCAVVQLVGFTKFTSKLIVQGFNIYSLTQLLLYIIV